MILDYVPTDLTIFYLEIVDSIHKQLRGCLQNLYQSIVGYLKQHCCMGITLLTKEITPINIFYQNEVQYRDDVPTKRKVGM